MTVGGPCAETPGTRARPRPARRLGLVKVASRLFVYARQAPIVYAHLVHKSKPRNPAAPPHIPKRPPHLDGGRASCQQICSCISWRTSTTNRVPRYPTTLPSTYRQPCVKNPLKTASAAKTTSSSATCDLQPSPTSTILTHGRECHRASVYPLSHPLTPSQLSPKT